MKLKIALASATALGLLTGAAMAGEQNKSVVSQNGSGNSQSVTQSGDRNDAGQNGLAMRQLGFDNRLVILQSGSDNDIGLEGDGVYQENQDQDGVIFNIDITQSSNFNTVGSVEQIASGDAGGGIRNDATILQSGGGFNRVGSVYQERKSSGRNLLSVQQTGSYDRVETIYQRSNVGGNMPNRITVTMSGAGTDEATGNGWADSFTLGGFADRSGAESSALKQGNLVATSRGNIINLAVSGTNNNFGITQNGANPESPTGIANSVGNVVISGADNEFGAFQNGVGNAIDIAELSGTGNNVGIAQVGNYNSSDVMAGGDYNEVGVSQLGDENVATVNITGNNNGGGTLAGVAGDLAEDTGSTLHPELVSGQIIQDGLRNTAGLTITGGGSNQFAFLQHGNDNVIDGTVSGTGSNSATMVQIGNSNTSSFTQSGGGNMVSVSQ